MFLEFFCMSKIGVPLTELYRLDTDTDSEIRATILQSPYHLIIDCLDHTIVQECAALDLKIKTADTEKRKLSTADIKRHAELSAKIERAQTWCESDVSVLLETETGDTKKALIWRGRLYPLFEAAEKLTNDNIAINLKNERGQAIHTLDPLVTAARSVDNPEKSSNTNTLAPIPASEALVNNTQPMKTVEQIAFEALQKTKPATQQVMQVTDKVQLIEITDPKNALPKLAIEATKQASNGLKIVPKKK